MTYNKQGICYFLKELFCPQGYFLNKFYLVSDFKEIVNISKQLIDNVLHLLHI